MTSTGGEKKRTNSIVGVFFFLRREMSMSLAPTLLSGSIEGERGRVDLLAGLRDWDIFSVVH